MTSTTKTPKSSFKVDFSFGSNNAFPAAPADTSSPLSGGESGKKSHNAATSPNNNSIKQSALRTKSSKRSSAYSRDQINQLIELFPEISHIKERAKVEQLEELFPDALAELVEILGSTKKVEQELFRRKDAREKLLRKAADKEVRKTAGVRFATTESRVFECLESEALRRADIAEQALANAKSARDKVHKLYKGLLATTNPVRCGDGDGKNSDGNCTAHTIGTDRGDDMTCSTASPTATATSTTVGTHSTRKKNELPQQQPSQQQTPQEWNSQSSFMDEIGPYPDRNNNNKNPTNISTTTISQERWEALRSEARVVITRRLLVGWNMTSSTCRGPECNNCPLLTKQKKLQCVVCGGTGNGTDGMYGRSEDGGGYYQNNNNDGQNENHAPQHHYQSREAKTPTAAAITNHGETREGTAADNHKRESPTRRASGNQKDLHQRQPAILVDDSFTIESVDPQQHQQQQQQQQQQQHQHQHQQQREMMGRGSQSNSILGTLTRSIERDQQQQQRQRQRQRGATNFTNNDVIVEEGSVDDENNNQYRDEFEYLLQQQRSEQEKKHGAVVVYDVGSSSVGRKKNENDVTGDYDDDDDDDGRGHGQVERSRSEHSSHRRSIQHGRSLHDEESGAADPNIHSSSGSGQEEELIELDEQTKQEVLEEVKSILSRSISSSRKDISKVGQEILLKTAQGWSLIDASCRKCEMPLLTDPTGEQELCVFCAVENPEIHIDQDRCTPSEITDTVFGKQDGSVRSLLIEQKPPTSVTVVRNAAGESPTKSNKHGNHNKSSTRQDLSEAYNRQRDHTVHQIDSEEEEEEYPEENNATRKKEEDLALRAVASPDFDERNMFPFLNERGERRNIGTLEQRPVERRALGNRSDDAGKEMRPNHGYIAHPIQKGPFLGPRQTPRPPVIGIMPRPKDQYGSSSRYQFQHNHHAQPLQHATRNDTSRQNHPGPNTKQWHHHHKAAYAYEQARRRMESNQESSSVSVYRAPRVSGEITESGLRYEESLPVASSTKPPFSQHKSTAIPVPTGWQQHRMQVYAVETRQTPSYRSPPHEVRDNLPFGTQGRFAPENNAAGTALSPSQKQIRPPSFAQDVNEEMKLRVAENIKAERINTMHKKPKTASEQDTSRAAEVSQLSVSIAGHNPHVPPERYFQQEAVPTSSQPNASSNFFEQLQSRSQTWQSNSDPKFQFQDTGNNTGSRQETHTNSGYSSQQDPTLSVPLQPHQQYHLAQQASQIPISVSPSPRVGQAKRSGILNPPDRQTQGIGDFQRSLEPTAVGGSMVQTFNTNSMSTPRSSSAQSNLNKIQQQSKEQTFSMESLPEKTSMLSELASHKGPLPSVQEIPSEVSAEENGSPENGDKIASLVRRVGASLSGVKRPCRETESLVSSLGPPTGVEEHDPQTNNKSHSDSRNYALLDEFSRSSRGVGRANSREVGSLISSIRYYNNTETESEQDRSDPPDEPIRAAFRREPRGGMDPEEGKPVTPRTSKTTSSPVESRPTQQMFEDVENDGAGYAIVVPRDFDLNDEAKLKELVLKAKEQQQQSNKKKQELQSKIPSQSQKRTNEVLTESSSQGPNTAPSARDPLGSTEKSRSSGEYKPAKQRSPEAKKSSNEKDAIPSSEQPSRKAPDKNEGNKTSRSPLTREPQEAEEGSPSWDNIKSSDFVGQREPHDGLQHPEIQLLSHARTTPSTEASNGYYNALIYSIRAPTQVRDKDNAREGRSDPPAFALSSGGNVRVARDPDSDADSVHVVRGIERVHVRDSQHIGDPEEINQTRNQAHHIRDENDLSEPEHEQEETITPHRRKTCPKPESSAVVRRPGISQDGPARNTHHSSTRKTSTSFVDSSDEQTGITPMLAPRVQSPFFEGISEFDSLYDLAIPNVPSWQPRERSLRHPKKHEPYGLPARKNKRLPSVGDEMQPMPPLYQQRSRGAPSLELSSLEGGIDDTQKPRAPSFGEDEASQKQAMRSKSNFGGFRSRQKFDSKIERIQSRGATNEAKPGVAPYESSLSSWTTDISRGGKGSLQRASAPRRKSDSLKFETNNRTKGSVVSSDSSFSSWSTKDKKTLPRQQLPPQKRREPTIRKTANAKNPRVSRIENNHVEKNQQTRESRSFGSYSSWATKDKSQHSKSISRRHSLDTGTSGEDMMFVGGPLEKNQFLKNKTEDLVSPASAGSDSTPFEDILNRCKFKLEQLSLPGEDEERTSSFSLPGNRTPFPGTESEIIDLVDRDPLDERTTSSAKSARSAGSRRTTQSANT